MFKVLAMHWIFQALTYMQAKLHRLVYLLKYVLAKAEGWGRGLQSLGSASVVSVPATLKWVCYNESECMKCLKSQAQWAARITRYLRSE